MHTTNEIGRWIGENLWLVPVGWALTFYAIWAEKRRLNQRIDAILTLLKARGIDIFDPSQRVDDIDGY